MINIFVINEFFVSKRNKREESSRENIRELSFHVIYFSTLKIAFFFQYMHNTGGGTVSIESVATLICVLCPVENISV